MVVVAVGGWWLDVACLVVGGGEGGGAHSTYVGRQYIHSTVVGRQAGREGKRAAENQWWGRLTTPAPLATSGNALTTYDLHVLRTE